MDMKHDPVNHPSHYTQHPSGVECIQITEHMSFCLGNAVKYIWRADLKGDYIEDLKKAKWYLIRELNKRDPNDSEPEAVDMETYKTTLKCLKMLSKSVASTLNQEPNLSERHPDLGLSLEHARVCLIKS